MVPVMSSHMKEITYHDETLAVPFKPKEVTGGATKGGGA